MYIKADQEKQKRLSIVMVVIVVGFVLSHQSFYVIPVIAQTNQNNVNAEIVSPTIYEIELAVKELPQGPIAYKLNKYIQKDNNNNQIRDITSQFNDQPINKINCNSVNYNVIDNVNGNNTIGNDNREEGTAN